jgi:mRNA-degrading endonuclease RelE of RelBE toxin-antitoxin system
VPARGFFEQRPDEVEAHFVSKTNKIIGAVPCSKNAPIASSIQNRVIPDEAVLIFKIDHHMKVVDIYYYNHHDSVYKWQPKIK